MAQTQEIYNSNLTPDSQNYSIFFSRADFLYLTSSDHLDWSQSGDFTEIDFDLLVTVEENVKRRVPLSLYASTREIISIPSEYSQSGYLMELVMQASFAAQLTVVAVRTSTNLDDVRLMLEALLGQQGIINPAPSDAASGGWFPSFPGG